MLVRTLGIGGGGVGLMRKVASMWDLEYWFLDAMMGDAIRLERY